MGSGDRTSLGDRMKENYEHRTRVLLPRRTYTVIRIDGRAFHTYTRGLDRPFDVRLMDDMADVGAFLCREVGGARLAYLQSDELSLVVTDFERTSTQAWFNGSIQKITSIAASLATARFNELRPGKLAFFDARVFTIPDRAEVVNYLIWRQRDATRNSISMLAQHHLPRGQLHGKNSEQLQELLFIERGVNWSNCDPRFKRGTVVTPNYEVGDVTYVDKRTGETHVAEAVARRVWNIEPAPIFTRAAEFLSEYIPTRVEVNDG